MTTEETEEDDNQTWDWGKVKKEENDAGGSGGRSRPPVGSRGKAPGRGLGTTAPEAEGFFCMSSQKTAFWSMKIRYLQVSKLYV